MGQATDELKRDIEATRRRMDRTLDRIERRVSPRRIARRRGEQLRSTWSDMKESVMGRSTESSDEPARLTKGTRQAADTVRGTPEAARRRTSGNPLAAGLVAFGAGLLAASLLPRTRTEEGLAREVTDRLEPLKDEAGTTGRQIMEDVQESAQRGLDRTQATATDAAETVRAQAQDAAQTVRDDARGAAEGVRDEAEERARHVQGQVQSGQGQSASTGDGDRNGGPPESGSPRSHSGPDETWTVEELQKLASERGIAGRSTMNKTELLRALRD